MQDLQILKALAYYYSKNFTIVALAHYFFSCISYKIASVS